MRVYGVALLNFPSSSPRISNQFLGNKEQKYKNVPLTTSLGGSTGIAGSHGARGGREGPGEERWAGELDDGGAKHCEIDDAGFCYGQSREIAKVRNLSGGQGNWVYLYRQCLQGRGIHTYTIESVVSGSCVSWRMS